MSNTSAPFSGSSSAATKPCSLSIVVPIHNEEENIPLLHQQLHDVLSEMDREYEMVFVDDGSTDRSLEKLSALAASDPHVVIVQFRRNYGQTAAMQAGIDYAENDVVVTMDGDLQNDPTDIPHMIEKIELGFDLVHGWRKNRQDAFINRKLPSKIANKLISRTTGFPIHDLGCTLKAIRREIAQELELYGEMHRFIPILAHRRGARCIEIVTKHHPRRFGQTKYGIGRTTRVVLDLITVNFLLRYFDSPMKLFGKAAMYCGVIGALSGLATVGMKLFGGIDMTGNPLLLQTVLSVMVSMQFFSLGIIGEVCTRLYYSNSSNRHYAVRNVHRHESQQANTLPVKAA
ncbi:MAG: glycosyltransferase family 2 protein [Rubinisphaera brasiliensis]|uniref:Glycosyl transferase family 2 n=1 Tax=Rubinisphaera brasiliensis (strain ATCC 49424 / DSM 5305 / JCM 21570 / IAM 15109 / NBRC 103401 / IFAM 1448) TaxID=756272 RepID=F0SSC5_RUBBR|nr:glycosyltransferase family 2 protein [Rubinisphaera brasiliensis]ADY59196.1 glycosyl transferase family 2 [Rubinisphaera brasiliensis DSM 5305]MBR9804794.1 glycosyltransferase family 2 protein [bacterium]